MKKIITLTLILISSILLSSCGKFEKITIHGMKGVKFRGMKDGKILLNLNLEVENPNNKKITISKIYFKAWLNNRELGVLKNSESIILNPDSRAEFQIPVEIVLRTVADVFKLMNIKEDLLNQLTIEGYIKGRALCFSKKMKIEKQPFSRLVNSNKGKPETSDVRDSVQTKEIIQNDTLIVK